VMESIEALPPGLYGMHIAEQPGADGAPTYDVSFEELRLEDVVDQLNRFKREDERPFEAMKIVSEFNQRAYELFGRPVVQALSNEYTAKLSRMLHPLRAQRWAFSDMNPALGWLAPTAQAVEANRQPLPATAPARKAEAIVAELVSANLDLYRALRDAMGETTFFELYGHLSAFYFGAEKEHATPPVTDAREMSIVKDALASIDKGGYPEALARVGYLMAHREGPLPLSRVQLASELLEDYREFLPDMPRDQVRRITGQQQIIVRYEPEKAIETLPLLLSDAKQRTRLLTLLDRVIADPRVQRDAPTPGQRAMLERIRRVLGPVRLVNGNGRASAPRKAAGAGK